MRTGLVLLGYVLLIAGGLVLVARRWVPVVVLLCDDRHPVSVYRVEGACGIAVGVAHL